MTFEEMKKNIVDGFFAGIEEIASDFAQEFCDAINQAEQLKYENDRLSKENEILKRRIQRFYCEKEGEINENI